MNRLFVNLAIIGALFFSGAAMSQTTPNLFDPAAREQNPDLSGISAIRFLTSADYPPFNYRSGTGELVGFNIDLANAICENLKLGCTMQIWPWEQAADALEDFQGDALIAGLAIDPESGARFDFSRIYMMLPGRFVTQKLVATEFNASDLAGKTVGVRDGSAHYEFVRRYLPNAELTAYDSEFDALVALQKSEIFAFFGDGLRASIWLNQNPDCCEFAGGAYFNPQLFGQGLAIAFAPEQDQMRRAVNYALTRLKREGVLDELYLRWFPIGFY
ncbi:MAG: transporter substrate-binding domain-containing protein [Devosiaceae bacterium]|nr:transporter substrate-binding domain-containing protein [Devosiaceae bacterium]